MTQLLASDNCNYQMIKYKYTNHKKMVDKHMEVISSLLWNALEVILVETLY